MEEPEKLSARLKLERARARRDALICNLLLQIRAYDLSPPILEYQFAPPRKWALDGAWVSEEIGFEVQGGTYNFGKHVRGTGYANDCRKLNAAQLMGWRVFWFPSDLINSGEAVQTLQQALIDG